MRKADMRVVSAWEAVGETYWSLSAHVEGSMYVIITSRYSFFAGDVGMAVPFVVPLLVDAEGSVAACAGSPSASSAAGS